jgi:hypothetical protein
MISTIKKGTTIKSDNLRKPGPILRPGAGGDVMPQRKHHSKLQTNRSSQKFTQATISAWTTTESTQTAQQITAAARQKNRTKHMNDLHSLDESKEAYDIDTHQPKTIKPNNESTEQGIGRDWQQYTQTRLKNTSMSNLPFGDNINDDREGELIIFHNINGMKDPKNWYQILTPMREMEANIFGFAELNQSLSQGYRNKWLTTIKKIFYYSRSTHSESRVQLETAYKPGGTMTTITGKWQSRVTELGQDTKGLGRWSFLKLRSKKAMLVIITAY